MATTNFGCSTRLILDRRFNFVVQGLRLWLIISKMKLVFLHGKHVYYDYNFFFLNFYKKNLGFLSFWKEK